MHMLFLGHVKGDIDMVSKWLGRYEILATFGKQANMYLQAVRNLRDIDISLHIHVQQVLGAQGSG